MIHIAYCAAQVACLFIQMCGHSRYRAQKHSVHKSDVVPLRPLKRISQNGNFHFIQRVMILLAYSFHYKISMKYVQNITLKMNWDIQIQTDTTVTGQYELLKTWINWTSLPYFGVKLSCVCLIFAYRKTSNDLYSDPIVTYSHPRMTYSYPKLT